jgi:hypothetical protein
MNPILNERPEGMSFDAYKEIRRRQQAALKGYKKGTIINLKKFKKKKP